jgi:Undecaprenyl-phosphate galactose phosphotransferase WbaP
MREVGTTIVSTALTVARPEERIGFGVAPPTRRRLVAAALAAGDLAAITIVVGILHLGSAVGEPVTDASPFGFWIAWALALAGAQIWFGLYGSEHAEPVDRLRRRSLANIAAAAIMTALAYSGLQSPHFGALGIVIGTGLAIPLGYYIEALVRGWLVGHALWTAPTVLCGTMSACAELARSLALQPQLGLRPIAILADVRERFSRDISHLVGLPVITREQAENVAHLIEVVLCTSSDPKPEKFDWLAHLPLRQIFLVHDTSLLQTLHLRTRPIGGLLGLEMRSAIHMPRNLRIKRIIDLALAIPVALAALPVIALLAIAVKATARGPAFYAQPRIGRNGRVFKVYKLRSMYVDAQDRLAAHLAADAAARREWERFFKLSNDPRILPGIGQLLRRSSLDELPQLWNVLRGDMSLVGPRPFPAYHSECFDTAFQALRTSVPPGLTGLWQVTDRSDGDLAVQKRQDSFYIHNWSFWLDFYVLLQTVLVVITARGAR